MIKPIIKSQNFPANPCIDCKQKQEDAYGLLCDLACGLYTAWLNYMRGYRDKG